MERFISSNSAALTLYLSISSPFDAAGRWAGEPWDRRSGA